MTGNLKIATITALIWSLFERVGQQGLLFLVYIILARLLEPADFGLIALVTVFLSIAQTFVDGGLGAALIQRKEQRKIDECTIFYTNIVIGLVCAAAIVFSAPYVARYFEEPQLTSILRALTIVVIADSIANIQLTIATKSLNFKPLFYNSIGVYLFSGTLGVYMAMNGYGVWSLVALSASRSLLHMVVLFFTVKWRPQLIYSLQSLRSLFAFGSNIFLSTLMDRIFNNVYVVIIGKAYTSTDLGLFSRARSLQQLPVDAIFQAVGRVTFPVFSKLQDDKERLKRGMRKTMVSMMYVITPMMVGMAATADNLVYVLLTERWMALVPYLQLFCVVGVLFPLHAINLNALKALGHSGLYLKLEIIKKGMAILIIFITYRYGIIAMIQGMIVASFIGLYINTYYIGKFINYGFFEQMQDIALITLISLLMGGGVFLLSLLEFDSIVLLWSLQIVSGVILYALLCFVFRIPVFMTMLENIKQGKLI